MSRNNSKNVLYSGLCPILKVILGNDYFLLIKCYLTCITSLKSKYVTCI